MKSLFNCKMTWEEKSQPRTSPPDSEPSREEEEQLEKATTAPQQDDPKHTSILCSACQQAIQPHHLPAHKKSHKAQALLGLDSPQRKADRETLVAQRQKLISKLMKTSQYSERERQKIDYSLEFLMDNRAPAHRNRARIGSPRAYREVKNSLIKAVSVCQDKNSLWQGDMEDRFIVLDNYGNRAETSFLGLVDGFRGATAAERVATELPLLFLDQLAQTDCSYRKSKAEQQILDSFVTVIKADYREKEKIFSAKSSADKSNTYEWIHKAYAKSFWRMDRLLRLGRNEVSRVRWSGCSAVTCLVEGMPSKESSGSEEEETKHSANTHSPLSNSATGAAGLLHLANVGNAHAVLCKNGKGHCLSEEHSTASARERERVLQSGGSISTNEPDGLVEGYLRTTRGLGHHGDLTLKRSVIPVPHTVSVPIDDTCQFLLLASNGLWEVLDYNEVLALTLRTFTHYLRMYEHLQQNRMAPHKCQHSMLLTEDNSNDSEAIADLQDGAEILYSQRDILPSDSKGNLKQIKPKPKHSRKSFLQSGAPKGTEGHKNQADAALSLCSNTPVNSQNGELEQSCSRSGSEELQQSEDRKVHQPQSLLPQSQTAQQAAADTATLGVSSHRHEQLPENVLATGFEDTKQPPRETKASSCNHDSGPQLAERVDSRTFCNESATYASQELLKTGSPVGSTPPPPLGEADIKSSPSNWGSQAAGKGRVTPETLYENAASYISEQLVQTALAAGSRDNITVLVVLLNGCDKIPNYLSI
ncbi:protein phosphatase 2C-like domain-containing protein 1 [Melanerpes formicivorus]|uniref:protein phosphatase 2C-like domain-containing protein 1 n=1 Tax=Melanerpes formicivorus TaxID=211600 RepID=UPI00358EAB0F